MHIRPSATARNENSPQLLGSRARQAESRTESPPRPGTPAPMTAPSARMSVIGRPTQRSTSARTKAPPKRQRAATTLEKPDTETKVKFDEFEYTGRQERATGKMAFVRTRKKISSGSETPQTGSSGSGNQGALPRLSRPKSSSAVERSSVQFRREAQDLPEAGLKLTLGAIVASVKQKPRTAAKMLEHRGKGSLPSSLATPSDFAVAVNPYSDQEYEDYLQEPVPEGYYSDSEEDERRDVMTNLPAMGGADKLDDSTTSSPRVLVEEVVIERAFVTGGSTEKK